MFFQQNLTATQIKKIISQNKDRLYQFITVYGQKISKQVIKAGEIQCLKRNYQIMIGLLNQTDSQHINNFSLHFIITLSNGLIRINRIEQAKGLLKKCQAYVSSSHSDPILLVSCLNNLANLQKIKGKIYKSLTVSLKALEIMQNRMDQLRQKKLKERLREDAVIYLIVIIRCKLTLSHILTKKQKKHYWKAYEMMNYLGYRNCLKYLGNKSIFIKKFTPVEKQLHLPIFKTQERFEKRQQHENQKLILEQLNKIHDVLKSKQNPDIIVVNTQSVIPQQKIISINQTQQSIQIINQLKQSIFPSQKEGPKMPKKYKQSIKKQDKVSELPVQTISQITLQRQEQEQVEKIQQKAEQIIVEISKSQPLNYEYVRSSQSQQQKDSESECQQDKPVIVEQTVYLDKWQLKVAHEKEKNQNWGKLTIQSSRSSTNKKKQQSKKVELNEQKLQKLINQLNVEDKLPYQVFNQQLQQDFIEYYITPFLNIDKEGNPIIHCKAKALIQPFQMKIFNSQSLIFFNHVRNNLFRISISSYFSYKSIYLNVEFDPISMLKYFTFQEQVNDLFTAIFKSITKDANFTPTTIKDKNKTCKIPNKGQLLFYLKEIIAQFQNSLTKREDETSVNQVLENEYFYYKFRQLNSNRQGIYYIVRYLPGINCFDIYLKNNYETYSIDGKTKARGNIIYKSNQFLHDFGVPLRCSFSKRKLFAYIQIIARKYTLMIFEKQLEQCQHDAYTENAILEFPIYDSCFKTKSFLKDNYSKILTISLLSINNEFPVGIKILEYSPQQCLSRGFFIHIVPQQWLRPLKKPSAWVNKTLFKAYIDQFDFRRDYFLPQWLQKTGFDILFEKLLDPHHSLYLQNNINRFIRGKNLIELFNNAIKI